MYNEPIYIGMIFIFVIILIAQVKDAFYTNEQKLKEQFDLGKECGYEEGLIASRQTIIMRDSRELTQEEHQQLIDFLVKHNMELCYDSRYISGFRVRKRLYECSNIKADSFPTDEEFEKICKKRT